MRWTQQRRTGKKIQTKWKLKQFFLEFLRQTLRFSLLALYLLLLFCERIFCSFFFCFFYVLLKFRSCVSLVLRSVLEQRRWIPNWRAKWMACRSNTPILRSDTNWNATHSTINTRIRWVMRRTNTNSTHRHTNVGRVGKVNKQKLQHMNGRFGGYTLCVEYFRDSQMLPDAKPSFIYGMNSWWRACCWRLKYSTKCHCGANVRCNYLFVVSNWAAFDSQWKFPPIIWTSNDYFMANLERGRNRAIWHKRARGIEVSQICAVLPQHDALISALRQWSWTHHICGGWL